MWAIALKWFLGGGWKSSLAAVVVGVAIVGLASLYGSWQFEKAMAEKYKAQRDAERIKTQSRVEQLNACLTANRGWEAVSVSWNKRVDALTRSSEAFRRSYNAERARRRASDRTIEEMRAEMYEAITATDCAGALDQLLAQLGWGGAE